MSDTTKTPKSDRWLKNCNGWHHVPIERSRELEIALNEALVEIEKKDARIKVLEIAPAKLIHAINSVQDWSGTYVGECIDEIEGLK